MARVRAGRKVQRARLQSTLKELIPDQRVEPSNDDPDPLTLRA